MGSMFRPSHNLRSEGHMRFIGAEGAIGLKRPGFKV